MKLKDYLKQIGRRHISRSGAIPELPPGEMAGSGDPGPGRFMAVAGAGTAEGVITGIPSDLPVENQNPHRQSIHRGGRKKFIIRLMAKIRYMIYHKPTRDEIALKQETDRRRAEAAMLKREAKIYHSRIQGCFEAAGLIQQLKNGGKKRVRFEWWSANLDCHYCKVNLAKRPFGVGVDGLVNEGLLRDMTMSCEHRVSVEWNEHIGVIYRIDRGASRSGVPAHVQIADVWSRFPDSADGLTICFGMSTNSRPIYFSLANMPHMLIGGTTGSGKSTGMNSIICTLIRRNNPSRLKLLLIDLKKVEFDSYLGVPHLLTLSKIAEQGIVKDRDRVVPALRWLLGVVEDRYRLLEASGDRKIERYNQHHRKKPLNRIVLIVDEWASIKLEPKLGEEAERVLTQIAEVGRAVGVHLIVATQTPNSQVLSTRIRNVLPAKLAYSCSNMQGSMAILGNGAAHNLYPPGRAILDFIREHEVQMPNINDAEIDRTVTGVLSGSIEESQSTHDVSLTEILEWSLLEENGRLAVERIFAKFRERGIRREEIADWMDEIESTEVMVNDLTYTVEPHVGALPRRLVAVDPAKEESE